MYIKWNERLKQARIEKGVSQKQAAEALQMSRTCYANYEQGTREPSFEVLCRICNYYEFPADYLIGRTDSY